MHVLPVPWLTFPVQCAMSLPRTLGELQLYRVLQRANLLACYETFIQQGETTCSSSVRLVRRSS